MNLISSASSAPGYSSVMDAFAIQRVQYGDYVAKEIDTIVADPHQAYLFCSREAAQDYIRRVLPADIQWAVARFPTTRPLP